DSSVVLPVAEFEALLSLPDDETALTVNVYVEPEFKLLSVNVVPLIVAPLTLPPFL
ncbi:unnamed protein product, partial [Rotaria socialis]